MYDLRPSTIWRFFKQQPPSYWLICAYLVLEYVRPQQIYPFLNALPLTSAVIFLCLGATIIEGRFLRKLNVADGWLALFTLVVLLSSAFAYSPEFAFANLELYVSWVLIYALISLVLRTEQQLLMFMLIYLLACLKMSQHGFRSWVANGFGFSSWGVTCAPAWFHNSGECGIQMAMFLPVSLFFAAALWPFLVQWVRLLLASMPITAAATIIATSSRGALVGLAGIGIWLVLISKHRIKAVLLATVLASVVLALTPAEQRTRLNEMGDDGTSVSRLVYWEHAREIIADKPLLGVGYYNWLPYYRHYYNPNGEMVHNVFYQATAELGYSGLAAFIGMITATIVLNRRTRQLMRKRGTQGRFLRGMATGLDGALIGFLITGSFVTVLFYPFFWINLAMTAALYTTARKTVCPARSSRDAARPVVPATA
ncbi:MAG TPA: O-antigen ligase family protein [Longimicrobiales bacterium]|nr:O-antigen ligase family protein [Longimicrobiales bacterium]